VLFPYRYIRHQGTLPVDVLMMSAPALIEISNDFLISALVFSSPDSMITFRGVSPQAALVSATAMSISSFP